VAGAVHALSLPEPLAEALRREPGGSDAAVAAFSARLARENGWSSGYAVRVIEEYRRFCWLAVHAGYPVSPAPAVDQAWHLHLLDSRDYWLRFCPQVLGQPLHHEPAAADGRAAHHEQYVRTLRAYEAAFGPPPADIWPAAGAAWAAGSMLHRPLRAWRRARLSWLVAGLVIGAFLTLLMRCSMA